MTPQRVLNIRQVKERTSLSRSNIYDMIKKGEFPSQVYISPRRVGWDEDAVHDWILGRLQKRSAA